MTYLRRVGIYLICVCVALLFSSIWQIKLGSGRADLSFLVFVPFAIGLLRTRSWAVWGIAILGGLSTVLVICFAVASSISSLHGLTVGFGPITMTEPIALQMWAFAVLYVFAFGIPMLSVVMRHGDLSK